jgi:hypothetical protein
MNFIQVWLLGILNPSRAFDELRRKPAPTWGFWAILVRYVPTALTTTLALHLLGRTPFVSFWEVALFGVGLSKMEGLRFWPACLLGLIFTAGVYIPLAMLVVR